MATPLAESAPPRRDGASMLAVAACRAALVGAAHAPALSAAFQFDDYAVIVDNPAVRALVAWWASMPDIRPLLKLSYALNHVAWPGPLGFHAVNLGIHLLNSLLAWRLAEHWLPRLGLHAPNAAALAALLFALHPATTEAVAYASGRSISLAATFMLAAWLADARFDTTRQRWSIASPLLFALALGVRETSLVVPLAFVLLAICAPSGETRDALVRRHAGHVLVVLTALGAFLALPGYQHFFEVSLGTRGLATQIALQLEAQAYLFVHPLLGLRTNIDPPVQAVGAVASPIVVAVLLATLALAALRLRRHWPWFAFAIGWYFLMLAPSNSLLPRLDAANDRHLYLALLGPAWLLVGLLSTWRRPQPAHALTALLLGVLGIATWLRTFDYRSEIALWTASLVTAPANARAWTNLGYAWQQAGDNTRARDAWLCALAFDPRAEQAILNLDSFGGYPSHVPRDLRACNAAGFDGP